MQIKVAQAVQSHGQDFPSNQSISLIIHSASDITTETMKQYFFSPQSVD
jgi:hypothetical protein